MDGGRIVQTGPPLDVYNHPRNLFVAGFIGSPQMTLLDVRLEADGDDRCVVLEHHRLRIPRHLHDRFGRAVNRQAILGLRPEHIAVMQSGAVAPGCEGLPGIVEVVEPLGPQVILLASCGASKLTACAGPEFQTTPGTKMEFTLNMNHMHLFDRQTGEAF
jgi:multiple sugar transport system ATP-binding protein